MVRPIDLSDASSENFTVDEVIALLDVQIDALLDDPDLTIQQAWLCVEMLKRVPVWAPRIVEQFVGVKQSIIPFFSRPWNPRTFAELEYHLLSYGKFEDEIRLKADGSLYSIDAGPMIMSRMVEGDLLILLPVHIHPMDVGGLVFDDAA